MRAETPTLTIGILAKQAEVNIQTIRYYERRGLLPTPDRTASNYRSYPGTTVRRVRFIKRAQELGFTLKGVGELLALRTSRSNCCQDVRAQSELKLHDIEKKIRSLNEMRLALAKLVRACSGHGPNTECPILDFLESDL